MIDQRPPAYPEPPGDEEAAVRLLRIAGARPAVPPDRMARARAGVHARWLETTRRRAVRRRTARVLLATAAAVLLLALGRSLMPAAPVSTPGSPVARIERLEGEPRFARPGVPGVQAGPPLVPGQPVHSGDLLTTDGRSRLALRFDDGTSVRLDVHSQVRPLSAGAIELVAGAVYVDTDRQPGQFEVRTPLATARDIGTQFEVRLLERVLRLRVRSGIVELRDGARLVSGGAGTEVVFSETAAISRPIPTYGAEWAWTAQVSPPPEIEGRPLAEFLDRVAREQGWTIRYADPALAREAAGIVLHGSVGGLAPQDAVGVAVTTSGLAHRLERGEIVVTRRGASGRR